MEMKRKMNLDSESFKQCKPKTGTTFEEFLSICSFWCSKCKRDAKRGALVK